MPFIQLPEPKDVPDYENEARKREAAEDEKRRMRNRKGRQSTILTGSAGLEPIEEENIEYKTLLGGS